MTSAEVQAGTPAVAEPAGVWTAADGALVSETDGVVVEDGVCEQASKASATVPMTSKVATRVRPRPRRSNMRAKDNRPSPDPGR